MQAEGRFVEFARDDVETSVPERFERQAALYPDHIAVKTRFQHITYSEFNKSANQIARAVRQHSSNDQPIALLLDHDLPAIVAIFAALKAAKCFVPLDPALPLSRLEYMLVDSGAQLVVTNNQRLALAHKAFDRSRVVNIDQIDRFLETENLGIPISSEDMSCILYTSGTTGRPKGVVHTHRNELHNVMHHTNSLSLTSDDRFTLFGSYSTGQGMQDFYCALLNGATLHPWNLKLDGLGGIAEWLHRERITVYHSAATVFRYFVKNLSDGEEFPDLRIIRLGSEQVTWKDLESYKRHFSKHAIFVNALSSSETKTIRQYIANKETQITGIVPIGYPVPDMEILMLDEYGNDLGPGQIGEIAVRSQFLSPGYWRSLELTNAGFRAERAGSDSRIFRTGEWGRLSADGCLEHLGRRDAQIKIRGYRVETNEIELALLRHPVVDQVLVLCRDNIKADKYLVAYMTGSRSPTPTVSELRSFLSEKIPEYMIPSAFVFLESFPITPNGKVDYNALPEPSTSRPALDVPFVSPTNPMEQALTAMWSEILGIDEIGVQDNHFDLGGSSLTAMQVVAQVEKQFRVPLSLKQFFESPRIASLSRAISAALGDAAPVKDLRLEPASRGESLPLSFAQQRLWFLDQWEPGNAVYNICRAHLLQGQLDVVAMGESLNAVVERHEVLRTSFPAMNGQPRQVIASAFKLSVPVVDVRGLPEVERRGESLRLANAEARQPFDLSQGPMLRAKLVRLADAKHLFVFTVHQIVCDGWSMQVLYREFWTLYKAFSKKILPSLPTLSLQYVDFAIWQRQWLRDSVLDSQITYWKEQLGESWPVLNLPADRLRPVRQSFRGSRQSVVLAESLAEAMKNLTRREGATLFITLMTAFQSLLYRYVEQNDLVVGFPIANRNWTETAGLVGFFVNTLVLRTNFSGEPRFRELLFKVREACLGAYAHQDLPFDKLIEELRPPRDLGRNPMFQSMFVLQIAEKSPMGVQGIVSKPVEVNTGTSKFDLTLSLAEQDKKLVGFFEYSTDLFDHPTIERMVGHFQTLLEGIVENPDQRISDLPILTEAERRQLLFEWNNTEADYPKDKCIHEMFQEQAKRTPNAIAVTFEGQRLTYRELNTKANQVARHLQRLGVGPGRLVGICLERSLEMVIGLLGILKAGGAYVPLDPSYPRERLAFMLEDAEVSVLLTQEKLVEDGRWRIEDGNHRSPSRDSLSSILNPRLEIVCLDRDWHLIETQSRETPGRGVSSDDLAYVIYTSGSTGKPKGVQVSHRSVVNCLHSISQRVGFTSQEVFLAVTTISFDIAGLELYLPLMVGGQVAVATREEAVDGERLLKRLKEDSVTAMQATPSTWRLLLDAGWPGAEKFKILCGGEALSRDLAEGLREHGRLWNLYGPTETTIWSAICAVERGERSVPIGRPIANTKIYILDSHLQPVPIGVHGELYIGGDGLARGYLNRPELMAEKFVANPFSDKPGSRLYKTGDVARYLVDGNIEFLARIDNQVKIRGHRIELGEIESVLNQHPSVKESVVIASSFPPPRRGRTKVGVTPSTNSIREEAPLTRPSPVEGEGVSDSDRRLVAFYVCNAEKPSPGDLRRYLREKLPEYMVPSFFVELDALTLTPTGKVDRNALPAPDGQRPQLDQGFIEPRTEIEELVTQVWREVLKLDKIGVYDNFFDLGGHSLLATRVVARLRNNFNIDLPLRKLFELPTVTALAEHVECLRRNQSGVSIPRIVPVPRDGPLPLSFSQRRLWFLHKLTPDFTAYNIPAVFNIKGELDIEALERALNAIIKRHESLRTSIGETDGNPVQQIIPSVTFTLPVVDLSHLPEDQASVEVQRLSIDDGRQPYDIQNAPLMRAKLLRLGEQEHVLILNFHHIVSDGSSLVIFCQELAALYKASLEDVDVSLPPLQVQYVDYAVWQHQWFQGAAWESQLAYWKGQLSDVSPLNLPTDYARPLAQTFRGARLSRMLSVQLTEDLKDLSRRAGVTRFMTLLAAFNILLARHSGQDDIVVGSTIAGRNRPELDGVIGFFINALALRTDLSGNPSFIDLLKRVREVCLDAYTHQDLPFEKAVEELNPQRDFSRNPLFQVLFNLADISERVLTLPGCEIVKLSYAAPSAKFDLTVYAPEIDGRVELAIVYNAELFNEARVAGLLQQFSYLLSQIVEQPERPIDQYSLVTPSAQAVLPDPTEGLDNRWEGAIHTLFAIHAERVPDRSAVIDADASWTYKELDERSNQLANYLVANGVKPKDVIAIYAHRSSALVLALLGILKAGAAFVILDPAYPASRLISYLCIARPRGWVQIEAAGDLHGDLQKYLENFSLCCRVNLPVQKNPTSNPLLQYPETDPGIAIQAHDPAYISFTSGSTGQPKGVLCKHGPMTHFLPWQKEVFDLRETDRFSLLSGLSYSLLHRDVFTALFLGAPLYIPAPEDIKSPVRLVEWLQQNQIAVLHLTPALGQLLQMVPGSILPSVRRVFFAGDALTKHDVGMTRTLARHAKVMNFYGATETQRAVGYFKVPEELSMSDDGAKQAIPLGRGVKDVQLLLLTAGRQLAGIGELGELYVRSPHLAEGYIGDDQLTQEKFLSNPFTNNAGDRLYRTGELGRYLPDGNVEWAGREDRRVNIRGFRVELAEVESALSQHPAVKSSVVVAKEFVSEESAPGSITDLRLTAYIAAEKDRPCSKDEIRCFLSARLPGYMVPSYIILLDGLPLTPSGKVDYKGLPPPEEFLSPSDDAAALPRTDIEQALSNIFAQVLGLDRIGLHDNFFHVGGHSLLAAQVAARVRETLQVALELRAFLETPTVQGLARQIEVLRGTTHVAQATPDQEREEIEI
ncbi:MAG: amino acid adenylation domain-containing protein [Deltaproteobacteria bacterium]|nr:amino acid adenylation domain-containing protein [Deltaproteobacteria bacterium]